MTTTAEKIKVMQAFENGAKIQYKTRSQSDNMWSDWNLQHAGEPAWGWDVYDYRIKPDNPKPLECFLPVVAIGCAPAYVYFSQEEASRVTDGDLITMREVTPQDEQDRLDARRYRQAKKLPMDVMEAIARSRSDSWDAQIDNEMGGIMITAIRWRDAKQAHHDHENPSKSCYENGAVLCSDGSGMWRVLQVQYALRYQGEPTGESDWVDVKL